MWGKSKPHEQFSPLSDREVINLENIWDKLLLTTKYNKNKFKGKKYDIIEDEMKNKASKRKHSKKRKFHKKKGENA